MSNFYLNYINPNFSLNKKKFNYLDLTKFATSCLASKFDHEIFLGELILEWFNTQDFITVTTSGTTGAPKNIKILKKAMIASCFASNQYFNIPENAKALHCLPIQYIAGKMMFVRALILGWDLTYIKPTSNPLEFLDDVFDFVAMVPLQVENSVEKLHKIKKIIIGGAKVNNSLKQNLLRLNVEIFETYGMTETVTHIAAKLISEEYFEALPNVDFYVDDRNCLGISAPRVSQEKIQTNDIVKLISNQKFEWLGRYDNVINSGGVKLFPEKIEEKLQPYIFKRFFVGGIPDQTLGYKLVLVIEGEPYPLDLTSIKTLNKFEIPKDIFFVPQFFETETSKIKRKEILNLLV